MSAFCAPHQALSARVTVRGTAASSRVKSRVALRSKPKVTTRAAISAPVSDDAEPPKQKPKTEAVRVGGANPLSAAYAMPTNDKPKGEPVRIKIDDQWYDARGWAKAHPGGERWIHFFDGRDGAVARARKLLHKLFKGGLKVGKSPDGGVGAPLRGESRDVVAGVHKVP